MALFKPKRAIQLNSESEGRPRLASRSSSNWSIPCCSHLSLYKRPAIQLPDDSDNEQDEYDQPLQTEIEDSPNIFSQHNTQNLSRNPFARAIEPVEQAETQAPIIENFEQELLNNDANSGDEELADFSSRTSLTKYAVDPYQDDFTETDQESSIIEDFEVQKDDENNILQQDDTSNDKVPQIEDDVLKMLPLPQLSMEIPPAMIHKEAPFEESKYSELPLMSTSIKSPKRVSRFSMTEEEYSAYKKSQEEEKIRAINSSIPKSPTTPEQEEQQKEDPHKEQSTINETTIQPNVQHERRASVVTSAAQSILGDKLDDFTEKLAFIKKNIIMSMDSEDEDEEVENAEQMLKIIKEQKLNIPNEQPKTPTLHRRASSLMDVAPSLARFMNQIGGEPIPAPSTSNTFSPSSLFSAFAGPEPTSTAATTAEKMHEAKGEDDDEEELFDFTKVLEIGKNVKTFGEGFVGNGLRMFNDVATRVKNSVEQDQQPIPKQKFQRNESTSSTSSSTANNENEWMHNYL